MNNRKIEVTVCCLTYNHENTIKDALNGFVMQKTNFPFKVIVHDDASTDNTAKIIKEYAEKYPDIIKPIYQKENQFSKRIDFFTIYIKPLIEGNYIASCEGDDYWIDEYKLQKQYDAMKNNPNCSFCAHRVKRVDKYGKEIGTYLPDVEYGLDETKVINDFDAAKLIFSHQGYPFQTSSYFYKNEIINSNLLPKNAYDIHIVRACLDIGNFYFINDTMSCYRIEQENSYTSKVKKMGVKDLSSIILNELDEEIIFDNKTKRKYHNIIYKDIKNTLIEMIVFYDEACANDFCEKHIIHIDIKDKLKIAYLSIKEKTKKLLHYDEIKSKLLK